MSSFCFVAEVPKHKSVRKAIWDLNKAKLSRLPCFWTCQQLVNIIRTKNKNFAAIQIISFRWKITKTDRFDLWHLEIFEYNRNKLIMKCCVPKSDSYSSLKCNLFSNLQQGNISLSATKWARKMKKMCYNIISRITFNPQQKKYKFLPAKKSKRENSHEPKPMVNEGNEQFSFSWCLCLKSHKSFIKKWNWIDRLNYKSLKFTVFFIIIWCEKRRKVEGDEERERKRRLLMEAHHTINFSSSSFLKSVQLKWVLWRRIHVFNSNLNDLFSWFFSFVGIALRFFCL